MKNVLFGAAAPILVLVLGSFTPTAQQVVSLKLSDMTLTRIFRASIPPASGTVTVTMPQSGGVVITSLSANLTGTNVVVEIFVNNNLVGKFPVGTAIYGTFAQAINLGQQITIDPPIVVRPNDSLMIVGGSDTTVSGYLVYPGEV